MKLLQFKASWCGPCKQQTKLFEKMPLSIELQGIDIDEDEDGLVEKYKIMSIPTMILINNDEIIKRWVGITSVEDIEKEIKSVKK